MKRRCDESCSRSGEPERRVWSALIRGVSLEKFMWPATCTSSTLESRLFADDQIVDDDPVLTFIRLGPAVDSKKTVSDGGRRRYIHYNYITNLQYSF